MARLRPLDMTLTFSTLYALTTVTATLTADNHYGLYTGHADGSGLTFIGRDELGTGGSAASYNWSEPETFSNFVAKPGDYLHVAAGNDGPFGSSGNPQAWIGSFLGSNGKPVVSNAATWEYKIGPTASLPADPTNGGHDQCRRRCRFHLARHAQRAELVGWQLCDLPRERPLRRRSSRALHLGDDDHRLRRRRVADAPSWSCGRCDGLNSNTIQREKAACGRLSSVAY